jgi:hypothetical protein
MKSSPCTLRLVELSTRGLGDTSRRSMVTDPLTSGVVPLAGMLLVGSATWSRWARQMLTLRGARTPEKKEKQRPKHRHEPNHCFSIIVCEHKGVLTSRQAKKHVGQHISGGDGNPSG